MTEDESTVSKKRNRNTRSLSVSTRTHSPYRESRPEALAEANPQRAYVDDEGVHEPSQGGGEGEREDNDPKREEESHGRGSRWYDALWD